VPAINCTLCLAMFLLYDASCQCILALLVCPCRRVVLTSDYAGNKLCPALLVCPCRRVLLTINCALCSANASCSADVFLQACGADNQVCSALLLCVGVCWCVLCRRVVLMMS
jgi:hypothetical protein